MLKSLVKKFTSHTLNDEDEQQQQQQQQPPIDFSNIGGVIGQQQQLQQDGVEVNLNDSTAGATALHHSTPKSYPAPTFALRSSVTNQQQFPQLKRNPLNSGTNAPALNNLTTPPGSSAVAKGGYGSRRGKRQQQPQQQQQQQPIIFQQQQLLTRSQRQQLQQQRSSNNNNEDGNGSGGFVGKAGATFNKRGGVPAKRHQQQDARMSKDEEELKDSGTESDDEELAIIETNSIKSVPVSLTSDYYTSQQSLSASCRSSHCGSPLPDQECISWDSFGCESGIGLRFNNNSSTAANYNNFVIAQQQNNINNIVNNNNNNNNNNNVAATLGNNNSGNVLLTNQETPIDLLEVELPNHHYHTRQQFRRFLKYQQKQQQNLAAEQIEDYANEDVAAAAAAAACGQKDQIGLQHQQLQQSTDDVKMAGVNFETNIFVGGQETPTTTADDLGGAAGGVYYDKQLPSPADSFGGSSVDELESINGGGSGSGSGGGSATAGSLGGGGGCSGGGGGSGDKNNNFVGAPPASFADDVEFVAPEDVQTTRSYARKLLEDQSAAVNYFSTNQNRAAPHPSSALHFSSSSNQIIAPNSLVVSNNNNNNNNGSVGVAEKRKWSQVQSGDLLATTITANANTTATGAPSSLFGCPVSNNNNNNNSINQISGGNNFSPSTNNNANAILYSGGVNNGNNGRTAFRTSTAFKAAAVHKNQVIGDTGICSMLNNNNNNNNLCFNELDGGSGKTTPTVGAFGCWKFNSSLNLNGGATTAPTGVVRRTPVRLVIPPSSTTVAAAAAAHHRLAATAAAAAGGPFLYPSAATAAVAAAKVSPRKKCRSTQHVVATTTAAAAAAVASSQAASQDDADDENGETASNCSSERHRPSLNFEKMREKLKNKAGRRKHINATTMAMKSKLRGWNIGYQLRSSHSDCLFKPLQFPPSPTGPSSQNSNVE